jgi:hypothetical protein
MTERQLTPLRCLENLFNSDSSPEDIRDPERMALAVLRFLVDSGFKIVPADDAEDEQ